MMAEIPARMNFEPPASNAPQQRAQHGFFLPCGRREDNVPQIDLTVAQGDAKHAAGGARILVASHNAREPFLVGSDAPDFDGLADAEVPVYQHRGAGMTHLNGLAFPQEFFPTFGGAETRRRRLRKTRSVRRRFFFNRGAACGPALQTELPDSLPKSFAKRHRQSKHNRWALHALGSDNLGGRFVCEHGARTNCQANNLEDLTRVGNRAMSGFQRWVTTGFSRPRNLPRMPAGNHGGTEGEFILLDVRFLFA